ncbi:MAG: hypothetical protein Q9201_006540 [Fulgogasparrea decipioides]
MDGAAGNTTGQWFLQRLRAEAEAREAKAAAFKAAEVRKLAGEINLPQLESPPVPHGSAVNGHVTQPWQWQPQNHDGRDRNDEVAKLEASNQHRPDRLQPLPTTPLSADTPRTHENSPEVGPVSTHQLQVQIQHQQDHIRAIEKDLKCSKTEVNCLRTERDNAHGRYLQVIEDRNSEEQRQPKQQLESLRQLVADLKKREDELEIQLHEVTAERNALRRRLESLESEEQSTPTATGEGHVCEDLNTNTHPQRIEDRLAEARTPPSRECLSRMPPRGTDSITTSRPATLASASTRGRVSGISVPRGQRNNGANLRLLRSPVE